MPILPQPELSRKSKKTSEAEFFGQSTSKGIITTKKPSNKKREASEVESDNLDHGRLKPARKSSKRTCSVVKCELSGSDAEEELVFEE